MLHIYVYLLKPYYVFVCMHMQGDCRITPFYEVKEVMAKIDTYAEQINADISILHSSTHGPHSKYTLPEEGLKSRIEFKWVGGGENGIACKLDSKVRICYMLYAVY
jgi:acetylornithine deacetylase